MNRFRIISLVLALLAAQFSYAGHYHSADDSHSEAECFLCIHASHLDNAIPASDLTHTSHLSSGIFLITDDQLVQLSQYHAYDSRAPPHQK